ncbi:UNVERIFIED_CONTAM: hypothetical protein GTU68_060609 [Idotea baltica]|nr:hypothetical protein [Idotea baltica]
MTFHDFSANAIDGRALDFSIYEGKVVLVVNTASKCGLTPQYEGLEALYQKYKDQGLVILGFPCNQFGRQEPGTEEEVSEFCEINYGVSFQMMAKIDVNGKDEHPIYGYLKNSVGPKLLKIIKWNFTKFLIGKDGVPVKRYAPTTVPKDLENDIQNLLA